MADNTTLPVGSGGDTIATDDIGGVKHQRVKQQFGPDGSATDVSAANPLPVDDADTQTALVTANAALAAIQTAVQVLDNIVAGSEAQVDVLTLPALPAGSNNIGDVDVATVPADPFGANADAAATAGAAGSIQAKLRLTTSQLDAIKTAVETLDNAVAGSEFQVDVLTLPALVASTAAIGKLAANSGVDIGDVDVTSVPADPFGANADAAVAAAAAGSIQAKLRRLTTDIDAIKTSVAAATPAGTNNIGDVDVLTLPATPAGTNLVGRVSLDPQTANGLTTFHLVSAASTNATNVKASAGQLYGWYIYNSNAAARKVAFHNTAGTPTAGASVVGTRVIPPLSAANVSMTNGIAFSTGIAITTVTELTDAGATGVAASDLIIDLFYK